ncbi:ABC transporter substrate-binding protein [bacterium]|nr:ABC transporter substrate-binding protein [bacterium]
MCNCSSLDSPHHLLHRSHKGENMKQTILRLITVVFLFALLAACAAPAQTPVAETTAPDPTTVPTEEAAEESMDESAAAAPSAGGFPVTVTDGLGRELTFNTPPQRVIALYNGNFGNLAVLGVRPVATLANPSMIADPRYFEDGESIPSVAGADGGIDLEAVAAAEPDLILASSMEEVQSMESIAPVYVPLDTDSLDGLYAETRNLATILGLADQTEATISAFQNRLTAYQTLAPREVTVMLAGPTGDELNEIRLRTVASPDCRLLNQIAICEWADPTGGDSWSYQTTPETLLELNPDYIYYWRAWEGTQEELLDHVRQNPLWAEVGAVQNERLYHVPGYTNPIASSLIAATQLLDTFAPWLYPEVFPDGPLTDEQVQEAVER